jgi:NAD(P)-dependent dehydrogenase (short-subunit alcohol dehydrogenase family)
MKPVAFITGASSGIGRHLALELKLHFHEVVLVARRQEALEAVAEEIRLWGGNPLIAPCDVRDKEQVNRAVAETLRQFTRIDLAILSAGIGDTTDAANFDAAAFARLVETNLMGVAYCLEALIPVMRQQGGGTIAVLSSLAADRGMPGSSGYCATKAALTSLCDGMRAELARNHIRLVTIEPGYVRTPMTARNKRMPFLMEADEAARLILRRINRGDSVIRFPLPASLFMRLMRALPVRLFDALAGRRQPVRVASKETQTEKS